MTKQWTNKEKFDILEIGSVKTCLGEKHLINLEKAYSRMKMLSKLK